MAPLDSSVLCTGPHSEVSMSQIVLLVVPARRPRVPLPRRAWPASRPRKRCPAAATTEAKININTADVKELMKLNGVGRNLAEKIVQYRDAHGPFKKATDLRKVEGLGDGLWEKNRERIVVK
jgi:competence ComEA-like helix-hairpin-helix protein